MEGRSHTVHIMDVHGQSVAQAAATDVPQIFRERQVLHNIWSKLPDVPHLCMLNFRKDDCWTLFNHHVGTYLQAGLNLKNEFYCLKLYNQHAPTFVEPLNREALKWLQQDFALIPELRPLHERSSAAPSVNLEHDWTSTASAGPACSECFSNLPVHSGTGERRPCELLAWCIAVPKLRPISHQATKQCLLLAVGLLHLLRVGVQTLHTLAVAREELIPTFISREVVHAVCKGVPVCVSISNS
mmetsp:Transcript_13927/g.31590  ORF Transcript_13927/g.31590 Transcript_13927/m.31590 type:complete len:242 (+) Transcript_13927:224-949(+)